MVLDISKNLSLQAPLEVKSVEVIDEKYICKECNKLLCDAVQTGCGERFCRSCVQFLSSGTLFCPVEKVECNFFNDKFAIKEILALEFYCPYFENCSWKGPLSKLKVHLVECEYAIQKCEKCGEEIINKNFDEHSLKDCSNSFFICKYCNENVLLQDKQTHKCLNSPVKCQLGCGSTFSYKESITHISKCNNLEKTCIYRLIGCKSDLISSVEDHYRFHLSSHNHLLMVFIQEMSLIQMTLKNEVNKLNKENLELHQQLESVKKYDREINDIKKTVQIQVDESASIFQALSLQVNDLKETNFKPTPIDDFSRKLSVVERSQEKLNETYSDLQLSQQILENTSYDGHLLWKISSYKQRSMAAMSGTIPALHSAPCYTSRFGYKYCLRLYLNGDGAGKGSYISLFLFL